MAGRTVTTTVTGLRELGQSFAKLKDEMQRKVARKAVRAAANLVRDTARANVDARGLVLTGAMRDSLAAHRLSKASKFAGREVWAVGVPKIKKKYVNNLKNRRAGKAGWTWAKMYDVDSPAYYWKFLEYGTVKYAATPFLNPALESNVGRATDKMADVIREAIDSFHFG